MDKYKDYMEKTSYTSNKVDIDKELFDDYMYAEKGKLVIKFDTIKLTSKNLKIKELHLKSLEEDNSFESSHKLFDKLYKLVNAVDKDHADDYFKGLVPYRTTKIKDVRIALNTALLAIQNYNHEDLENYEVKVKKELEKINEALPELTEAQNEKDIAQEKYSEAIKAWETQYSTLKSYYKGYFNGKDQDYKEYFLDLGKSRKKSKPNNENNEVVPEIVPEVDAPKPEDGESVE